MKLVIVLFSTLALILALDCDGPSSISQGCSSSRSQVLSYLVALNVPPKFLELIKNAPDSVVQIIMALPPQQLKTVINQLKQGNIPKIPGVNLKKLFEGFLGPFTFGTSTPAFQQIG